MQLTKLIASLSNHKIFGNPEVEVAGLALDSRLVAANYMFAAIKGTATDGHNYINDVIAKGATVILCEDLPTELNPSVTYIKVLDAAIALGYVASVFYGTPSAKTQLVGITGTNGKTSVATLLYQLFVRLGYKVGLISTVENLINGTKIPATHTTPHSIALNALLANMVEEGCDYVFMEVSSHSVVQHRIAGLAFAGGVFTNITHDHLDFHGTFDNYIAAKKLFFDNLPRTAFALTNIDDKRGRVMLQNTKAYHKTYSLTALADYKCRMVENTFDGLVLNIDNEDVWMKMIGSFNAYNLMAVYATAMLLEQDKAQILVILSSLTGAEGRFESLKGQSGKVVIVDYAHTPDALKNVLQTINDIKAGHQNIITVIGCGGDRDHAKRPIMAEIAVKLSQNVILTSDNPRSEDPMTILSEMEVGVGISYQRKSQTIPNRHEAIETACKMALPADIILIAGKGHEKYQDIAGVKHHFDDKEEVMKWI